jgi:CRISPR/Cas system-associated exonuclease Cas4 (RecB family)
LTSWRHSVSWSKFKLGLPGACQLQLRNTIEKRPPSDPGTTYYQDLGKLVQYAFELYFNQGINKTAKGRSPEVMERVIDKIWASDHIPKMGTTYPMGKSETDLRREARIQVLNGHDIMRTMGILDRPLKSEVKWNSIFRGFRLFGMVDFIDDHKEGVGVYDGKGHVQKNADPKQVLYYALAIAASGKKILKGGLIYWRHGYEPLDLSPRALRDFIDGEFQAGREVFDRLATGTDDLPPNPTSQNCNFCSWKTACPASVYRRREADTTRAEELTFGEAV